MDHTDDHLFPSRDSLFGAARRRTVLRSIDIARSGRWLLLFLLVVGVATVGAAQEPQIREAKSEVEAIPLSDVLDRADTTLQNLEAVRESFAAMAVVQRIEEQLPGKIAAIDRLKSRAALYDDADPSFDAIAELESQWLPLAVGLPDWKESLSERVEKVIRNLDQLATSRREWRETGRFAREAGAPSAVRQRIEQVLTALDAAIDEGNRRQAALLTTQAAVSAQADRIDAALSTLGAARERLVESVFEQDSPPIWAAELRPRLSQDLGERVGSTLRRQLAALTDFVRANRTGVALEAVLFLVLSGLLFAARARVRRRTEEERGLERVADIFEFPVLAALLLTLLMAPWIFPYVPSVVEQMLGATALVPTVVIVRRLVPAELHALLYALVGFYFVDRVRELVAPLQVFERALFLLELLVAIVLLGWVLRPARLTRIPAYLAQVPLRLLGLVGRIAFVLLVASFVANVAGFALLGGLVGGGVLESAFVGLVAYASLRVLDSLVTFALRVWPLGQLQLVQRSRYSIRQRLHRVLVAAVWVLWLYATLGIFSIREPVFEAIRVTFTTGLSVGSLSISLGDVTAFVLTVWAAVLFSRFLRAVLEQDVFPRVRLARGVPYAASSFVHYVILLLGFLLAVAATGIDLDRFALLAGAFSVGIGFGMQNIVNNFVSGLILLSERPVQVGDMVESEDSLGEIKRIGIRSSTVRTLTGAELIIPNADLISQRVINWTLADRQRRLDVAVGVAYGSDRHQMLEILLEVGTAHPDILTEPPPTALFLGFGESSLDFELRAWTLAGPQGDFARVRSELAMAIGDALDAAGIEVPFPQRDVHVRSVVAPSDPE